MDRAPCIENRGFLVHLAAEALAPLIRGCAGKLANGSETLERQPWRAINYFGPPIIDGWLAGLGDKSPEEQLEVIVQLGMLSAAEAHREAVAAVEQVAGDASAEDQGVAADYLATIPLTVRRSLICDPVTGRMSLPKNLWSDHDQTLIRLLPTDVPPLPLGSDLPGTSYRLEELLGIGGFGAVYRARNRFEQNQPSRAIKFCLEPSMVATLHRERAILDRLMAVDGASWSDRIVRLYGYALDVQPPFLVYEFVSGGDLTSRLIATQQQTGRGFSAPVALGLIRQVTEALAFAHGQGLVHRDLKPANVLVSGDTIKLTDFGIGGVVASHAVRGTALQTTALTQFTPAEQARLFYGSGTPLYMSPEQRRGDQPDPRHDLFSLGVMWYQLLVGDVTRELHPGWPDELIEEFQTPREHIELLQRCVGYFKKRSAHAGELLGLLQAASPGRLSVSVPAEVLRAAPAAGPGHTGATSEATAEFDRLQLVLVDQIDRDVLKEARETATTLLRLRPSDPEALEALAFIDKRLSVPLREVHTFKRHHGWVRTVAFTSDGRSALSGGDDATLRLWDVASGREQRSFRGHTGAVMGIGVSPDGQLALSASWDGTARLWDVAKGAELHRIEGDWTTLKCVAFSPDGQQVLTGGDDQVIRLWDLGTAKEVCCLAGHDDLVQGLAFTPDGLQAISGSDDGTVRLWDLESGQEVRCFRGHADAVTSVACAPNGSLLLSASSDRTVRLWDLASGRELRRLAGHASWVNSVTFSPDGRGALTGSGGEIQDGAFLDGADKTVRLWDLATGQERCRFEGHEAPVTSVALSPDGRLALSGSLDKTVRLLSLPS